MVNYIFAKFANKVKQTLNRIELISLPQNLKLNGQMMRCGPLTPDYAVFCKTQCGVMLCFEDMLLPRGFVQCSANATNIVKASTFCRVTL